MKKTVFVFIELFLVMLLISFASSEYVEDTGTTIDPDHAMRITGLEINPSEFSPGNSGKINLTVKNNGAVRVDDLRVELDLPDEFKMNADVNKVKISELDSLEEKEISFNILASPTASEGVYDSHLILDYTSFSKAGTSSSYVGQAKQDNYTFSLIIRGTPDVFAQIEKSDIYKGNEIGVVTVKLVNRGTGDAKFLTVGLLESEDYDIISSSREYVGDLDSDDFESVDFRIELNREKDVSLLLKAEYKDSLNRDYTQEITLPFEVRAAKELGIKTNGTSTAVVIVLILGVIGYFVYRRYRKNKKLINI